MSGRASALPAPLLGMAWMVAASALWAGWGASLKWLAQSEVPLALCLAARPAAALLLLLPWALRAGPGGLTPRRPWLHLGRSAAGLVSTAGQLYAMTMLPLADAIAIAYAKPLWLIPLAILVLGERVRWRRGLATALGFAGVLVITGPQGAGGAFNPGVAAALVAGLSAAAVLLALKPLATAEPASRIVFVYSLASLAVFGPAAALSWRTPDLLQIAVLVFAGVVVLLGDYCATFAIRLADATVIAPTDYVQVPMAAGFGWLLFGERSGWPLVLGTGMMVAAVWYIARREATLRRAAEAADAAAGPPSPAAERAP